MRISYNSEADIPPLCSLRRPSSGCDRGSGGVLLSYGEYGEPVSVEFLNASVRRLMHAVKSVLRSNLKSFNNIISLR